MKQTIDLVRHPNPYEGAEKVKRRLRISRASACALEAKSSLATGIYNGRMSWRKKLSRPLTLKDGTTLKTLADVRACFLERFAAITHNEALAYAGELLLRAAETGEPADIEAATAQVQRALIGMRLMR